MSVTWVDTESAEVLTVIPSYTSALGILNQMLLCSNAVAQCISEGEHHVVPATPGAGFYDSVGEVLAIQMSPNIVGHWNRLLIPAPKGTLFYADGQSMDEGDSLFGALTAAILHDGYVIPYWGNYASEFHTGWLLRRVPLARETYYVVPSFTGYRRTLVFVDSRGGRSVQLVCTGQPADDLMGAIQGLSNASVVEWWEGTVTAVDPGVIPDVAYASVSEVASLYFQDDYGNRCRLNIPAPKTEIFRANGIQVDRQSELVEDLVAEVLLAGIVPSSGERITSCIGGWYQRKFDEGII